MKGANCFLIIVSLLFSATFSLQAQKKGTEFWLTFGTTTLSYNSVDLQIRIVSGNNPTTVTIHFTTLETSFSHNMEAHEIFTYKLDNIQRQAVYNTIMGISNLSIHITSVNPVAVYAMNFGGVTMDATNILPVTALGTEYYQISYFSFAQDAYAVVATQDNTKLLHNGSEPVTLNAGQVYYRTATTSDMTGDHITTDKPVAFFAVNSYTIIPTTYILLNPSCLMQQLAPIKTWDNRFFVPCSHITQDIVRIVISQNNTDVTTLIGGTILTGTGGQTNLTNLQAGDFVELEISNTGCFIEANKPIGVCSYQTNRILGIGSSAQCWIPALKQTVSYALIAPFTSNLLSYFYGHYAMVCAPKGVEGNTKVSIAGAPFTDLTGGSWIENTAANMSFYRMPLTNDTAYIFTNPAGLIVLCYADGWGASYYYLAGSAMRELDAAFYANNMHFQDLKDTTFCANEIVNFRAEIDNMGVDMDSIKWYIDGVMENLPYNQLEWSKTFLPGNYEIKMWVRFENDSTITKADTLNIKNCEQNAAFYANNVHYSSLQDTTFCAKDVDFHTDIEGLNIAQDSIKWYINLGDGNGFIEYVPVRNLKQWSKVFPTGTYLIKMWARLENDEEIEITGTLNMEVLWIKMRNVRY